MRKEAGHLSRWQAAGYGLMGLPLAFVALPLYVHWPNYFAREFGISLSTLGALLLATRFFDALIDPFLGRLSDRLYKKSLHLLLTWSAAAGVLLAAGFALLFFPPSLAGISSIGIVAGLLMLTYAAFSAITLAHQSWGALLGGGALQQGRLLAWREGLGLLGVLLASTVPVVWGVHVLVVLLPILLALAWLAWRRAPKPARAVNTEAPAHAWGPWRHVEFRCLWLVFLFNGIASAVPATLMLFFVQDRLQAPSNLEPVFLGGYFLSAAVSMPLWLSALRRWGLAKSWFAAMVLALGVFAWAGTLAVGDGLPFIVICALSGLAFGADLVMPGAMLAGFMVRTGDLGRMQGVYYGWWNFTAKLNLALAAGLALPLLSLVGYAPGSRDPQAQQALAMAYCVLPCVLKLMAATLLYGFFIRPHRIFITGANS